MFAGIERQALTMLPEAVICEAHAPGTPRYGSSTFPARRLI